METVIADAAPGIAPTTDQAEPAGASTTDREVAAAATPSRGSLWPLGIGAAAAALLFLVLGGWRLPRDPPRTPFSTLQRAALAIAMMLVVPVGATLLLVVTGSQGHPNAVRVQGVTMLGAYIAQALVLLAAWPIWMRAVRDLHRRDGSAAPSLEGDAAIVEGRTRRDSIWRQAGIGVLAFALAWPIVALVVAAGSVVRESVTGEPTEQLAHETLKALETATGHWKLIVILLAALAAPFFEEIIFRGLIQPALRMIGAAPWTAITLTSILFAVVHWGAVPPPALVGLFVLSLSFGWARERTGGLLAPLVAHALFNIGNLTLANLLANP